jgi:P-type E1-E2 ATPase
MPLTLAVPGFRTLLLEHLVLDVNGTLALDGELLPGVSDRLTRLRETLTVHILTADTHGRQSEIDAKLGLCAARLKPGQPDTEQKTEYLRRLGGCHTVAIGNGANDAGMFREAELAIAVLGTEGLATVALWQADIIAPDICTALDLLLNPRRLTATLRR